ncbi:MAG: amidohydrolase [Bacteroidetes bacterium]|nr:MAG: amidohydrolase [Bacteroidota bacterium]
MKIDAHQHFWQFDPIRDAWIDDTMKVIRRDFLPEDLQPVLLANSVNGCVAVQADQSETETDFLLQLAAENSFIKGVVGWVDLVADNLGERLDHFVKNPLFKGVRHIAQAEADDYFLRKDVQKGISQLAPFGLTYDILVYAHQLPSAIELVRQCPNQQFVLDHIAKPEISEGISEQWRAEIKQLAAFENVSCKLSGMVTETKDFQWNQSDFTAFLDVVVSAFGVDRVLYGSDWPVCLLAAQYRKQLAIVEDYIDSFSEDEQAKIMGGNAIEFYNLTAEKL